MGSCVSKKAARGGAGGAKVAAPLPPEKDIALPPPVLVVEEEVKEVLSETAVQRPRPPEPVPEQEKVKRIQEHEEGEASDSVSVGSSSVSVVEKTMVKSGSEQEEVEKRTVDAPEKEKAKRRKAPDQRNPNDVSNARARSPSPAPKQRRQEPVGEQPKAARSRREQPAVVSGIGCRSGRFSPSTARRAAESAVRRTYSAREADMALPSSTAKRSLNASISSVRRDPGERSGRRPDSPARRTPASPAANGIISRQSSATRHNFFAGDGGGCFMDLLMAADPSIAQTILDPEIEIPVVPSPPVEIYQDCIPPEVVEDEMFVDRMIMSAKRGSRQIYSKVM